MPVFIVKFSDELLLKLREEDQTYDEEIIKDAILDYADAVNSVETVEVIRLV